MTKPTPEQIQRACDLANAGGANWTPRDYENQYTMICALADTIAELDAEKVRVLAAEAEAKAAEHRLSVEKARADKAVADLREIDRKLSEVGADTHRLSNISRAAIGAARALAAPYRVETDPLVAEAREIVAQWWERCPAKHLATATNPEAIRRGDADKTPEVSQALAALKRGLEIGRSA